MSTATKKFLFWHYKGHVHEWKEEFREFGEMVSYSPPITGMKKLDSRPVTNIYWVCIECGKRRQEMLYGYRPREPELARLTIRDAVTKRKIRTGRSPKPINVMDSKAIYL